MSMNTYKDLNKFDQLCGTRVGRLQCKTFKIDRQGAVTDTLTFDFNGQVLLYFSTFYGNSFTLNPGPHHQNLDHSELTKEEHDYVWECVKASGIFI
jgi:hypothetical protein